MLKKMNVRLSQKISCKLQKLMSDVVTVRLEGDALHLRMTAARAAIPPFLKSDYAKARAKAQVPEHSDPAPVDVHFLAALRAERDPVPLQFSM